METKREDIRHAFVQWSEYSDHSLRDDYYSFEAGVLWSEATLKTREKNVRERIELEEENKRLKEENDDIGQQLFDRQEWFKPEEVAAKDRELSELHARVQRKQEEWERVCRDYKDLNADCEALREALQPFANLAEEVFNNKLRRETLPHMVLYAYNKAEITYEHLSKANAALSTSPVETKIEK